MANSLESIRHLGLPGGAAPLPKKVTRFLRATFVAGLIVLSPFILTYLVLRFVFNLSDGLIGPVVADWLGVEVPGVGLAALVLVTFVAGFVAINIMGRRLFWAVETLVVRVPVIGPVFAVCQQLVDSFGGATETGFTSVVEIEYPRRGLWAIGFLTSVVERDGDETMGVVYIPTAPTPNSGWLALVPIDEVRHIDMSANEAMRTVLSGGVAAPSSIIRRGGFSSSNDESSAA